MDQQKWLKTKKSLMKLYTLIVDRRFLFYIFVLAFTLFGFPQAANQADALNKQVVDAIVLIAQAVTALGGAWALLKSWGVRPPSGLDFDKVAYDRSAELARILRELGVDKD